MLQGRREEAAMRRTMGVYSLAASLILVLSVPVSGGSSTPAHEAQAAGLADRVTACGVRAYVIPDPVSNGARPTLYVRTAAGAVCTASVLYTTGDAPRSFDGSARAVGSSRVVGWTWHMQSSGTGGTATVTCSLSGQTRNAKASFAIAQLEGAGRGRMGWQGPGRSGAVGCRGPSRALRQGDVP
jgi:hypothetical protein